VFIVLAVVLFKASSNLASAYGIAVTLDMTITTVMTFFVIRYGWKYPLLPVHAGHRLLLRHRHHLLRANMLKLVAGGWFPLVIGIGMFTLMMTWKQGRKLMAARLRDDAIDLALPGSGVRQPADAGAGTAVFLSMPMRADAQRAAAQPQAQQGAARAQPVRHRAHHEVPWIGFDNRIEMEPLGHDCWQVAALRLQERPRRARGAEAAGRPRRAAGRHGHQLLPQPRHRDPHLRRRHGDVAREAVCQHAPQCRGGGRLPEPAHQPRRGAGLQGGGAGRGERRSPARCRWCWPMLLAYLAGQALWPRYAVPGVLAAGIAVAALQGQPSHTAACSWQLGGAGVRRCRSSAWQATARHGPAAVHRHHGLAEPAGRGGAAPPATRPPSRR
jgi:hypothetical protein